MGIYIKAVTLVMN